ncbi:NUDIX domain-containing protein [Roseofilum sp. Guam]|uniref:NUDIX domain-containing protein n=1 Tax=Roseofilum sp. Guam TaxID=2821502 RepID=UPI001B137859|nr:NUDIX domain-containing protein [Roseofilum sp. Guam]MBP0026887.1 NUDIX domain-containing protein [Roseofilum sp. Guam]
MENQQIETTKPQTRLRVAVVALFVIETEVLLIHQMTFPEPDCWDLPGGGIEPHEPIREALRREVKEETGIENFEIDDLLTIAESFFPEGGDRVLHTINIIYQCSLPSKPTHLHSDEAEIGPKGIQWVDMASVSQKSCSTRCWQALQVLGAGE